MMDILIQILLFLAIIVAGFLIVVLWRWNTVLINLEDTAKIAKKRARDFDSWLSQTESTIKDFADGFKGFLNTFEQLKNIKNKMSAFWESEPILTGSSDKTEKKKEDK